MNHLRSLLQALLLSGAFLLQAQLTLYAGSATWNLNPSTIFWSNGGNWTPATVPNGPGDIATFGVSNTTSLSVGSVLEVDSIVFEAGASPYSLTMVNVGGPPIASFTFSGVGVINNSGIVQSITSATRGTLNTDIFFTNSATAGDLTSFVTNAGIVIDSIGATIQFLDNSNAGTATFTNQDTNVGAGGMTEFFDNSSAASGTFIAEGGEFPNYTLGGKVIFNDQSTAASGTFIAGGGQGTGAGGGEISFFSGSPSAGRATLIANSGAHGGAGGTITFSDASTGDSARVQLFRTGTLSIGEHDFVPGLIIGSLEGDGLVDLGFNTLTVGQNNLDTTFAGVISGNGSLTKVGHGKLTLAGANTYIGLTQVKQGELLIQDSTGLLTIIPGNVEVDGGTFGGSGTVAGRVTVGAVSQRPTKLEANQLQGGNFIIQKTLKFNPGATYNIEVNSNSGRYSNVWAKQVAINEGTSFTVNDSGNGTFSPSNLVAINNTGSSPISGTFSDLPEGGVIVVGNNTYVATYHGGDGNDFVLMVNQ